jgi:hypothetical protein
MSLKAARTALAAQITTAVAGLGDVDVLAFDPASVSGDVITVSTAGLTTTEYRLFVRAYVPAVQSQEGQDLLDDLIEAVEVGVGDETPRSDWVFGYDQVKNSFVMTSTFDYPRPDF